jgi:hypothetical protein
VTGNDEAVKGCGGTDAYPPASQEERNLPE